MPRSPLILAAAVAAAVPDALPLHTRVLGGGTEDRFDTALVRSRDGRDYVVRVAASAEADRELRDEARVLESLSAGVRSLLPFRAPEVLGRAVLADAVAVVTDHLAGDRVSPDDLGSGGVASALGAAIAAVHDLPVSVVRDGGFPVRIPDQARVDLSRLVDRTSATGRLDASLRDRWRAAIDDETLWRFEPTVILGGTDPGRFVLRTDDTGLASVVGLLGWQGLSVGDPASDLTWLTTTPDAAGLVLDAYGTSSHRAPDPLLMERARLYAELDFARWLLHGLDDGDQAVVEDAEQMLRSLAASTSGVDLVPAGGADVIDAAELLDRMPSTAPAGGDTSMQTDAYDPKVLAAYLAEEDSDSGPVPTLPVDLSEWTADAAATGRTDPEDEELADEASRASRSALQWWTQDDSPATGRA